MCPSQASQSFIGLSSERPLAPKAALKVVTVEGVGPADGGTAPKRSADNPAALFNTPMGFGLRVKLGSIQNAPCASIEQRPQAARLDSIEIVPLSQGPSELYQLAPDVLQFCIRRADNNSGATDQDEENDVPGIKDPIVNALGTLLLLLREDHRPGTQDLRERIIGLIQEHVESTYRERSAKVAAGRGGLAPWQQRVAKDMMEAKLTEEVPLCAVAKRCGLSTSHFARAFRESFGVPPHRWKLELRVNCAKKMLEESGASLSDIALHCGFSDQSHFTRIFSGITGESPGRWKRRASASSPAGSSMP